jgi:hypothetical protein
MTDKPLENANRSSGSWLKNANQCRNQASPCGNPLCADEAMRSANVRSSNLPAAEQALKHAKSIAQSCKEQGGKCPLEPLGDVQSTLNKLAGK